MQGEVLQATVNNLLQVPLETLAKVLEHGRSTRENDVLGGSVRRTRLIACPCVLIWTNLVQTSSDVDGRLLDDAVDDLGKRCQEVGGVDLWVEEDLRGEESLVTDVDFVFLSTWSVTLKGSTQFC